MYATVSTTNNMYLKHVTFDHTYGIRPTILRESSSLMTLKSYDDISNLIQIDVSDIEVIFVLKNIKQIYIN